MNPNGIQLIAIDIDGTLMDESQLVPERNRQALLRAQALGIAVVIASGRAPGNVRRFSQQLGLMQPIIAANGAVAQDAQGEEWFRKRIPNARLQQILSIIARYNAEFEVYKDDGLIGSHGIVLGPEYGFSESDEPVIRRRKDEIPRILEFAGEDAVKVVTFQEDLDSVRRLRRDVEALDGLEVNSSWIDNVEILAEGAHKGAALRAVCAHMHIPLERSMALGDGENDIAMIQAAGLGIAMENAHARVLQCADARTASNAECGVALAIERYILGG